MKMFAIMTQLMQHKMFASMILASAMGIALFAGIPGDVPSLQGETAVTTEETYTQAFVTDFEQTAPRTVLQETSVIILPVLGEDVSGTDTAEQEIYAGTENIETTWESVDETTTTPGISVTETAENSFGQNSPTEMTPTDPVMTEGPTETEPLETEIPEEPAQSEPVETMPPSETVPPVDPPDATGNFDDTAAYAILDIVNARRAEAGLPGLVWNDTLVQSAAIRAPEIVICWSHTRPDGTPWYTAGAQLQMGENLAYGQTSAEQAMNEWMASPGHAENILRVEYTQLGVSCYIENGTYYWVQHFA